MRNGGEKLVSGAARFQAVLIESCVVDSDRDSPRGLLGQCDSFLAKWPALAGACKSQSAEVPPSSGERNRDSALKTEGPKSVRVLLASCHPPQHFVLSLRDPAFIGQGHLAGTRGITWILSFQLPGHGRAFGIGVSNRDPAKRPVIVKQIDDCPVSEDRDQSVRGAGKCFLVVE